VLGYVRPAINFEIRLPSENWNGKFYMAGCGAWCGKVEADRPGFTNAPNHGLRRNYATSTMDGGTGRLPGGTPPGLMSGIRLPASTSRSGR
jgi:feruloyl esterase